MAVRKICVLGLGKAAVPFGAVIAYKCPEIRVTVVKTNSEDIYLWNSGKMPQSVPGLEEFVRKCQNKNLVFTTNEVLAVKEAEIIFILSESKSKTHGEGKNQTVDLSVIEEEAYLIAEHAESSKIVVENSCIPLKTAECLSNIFKHNSKPGVEFQVLSNPEFYEYGSSLRNLLFPDCVLIGSENTPAGVAAARKLSAIYERWVPPTSIITRLNWSVELSKIGTSAMAAQALASFYSMCCICEETGGDVTPLLKLTSKTSGSGGGFLEVNANVGKLCLVLHNLVYMCEFMELWEVADYWRHVLEMFNLHRERFWKKFTWTLNQTWNKSITLLGFAYYKDTEVTEGSAAVDLCKSFLEESATVSIYDPKVTKKQVLEDLKSAGYQGLDDAKAVTVWDDPYKAVQGTQVLVTWGVWSDNAHLDFVKVFELMVKPAYVFDRGLSLPHEELSKIGFKVYAIGRCIHSFV